MLFTSSNKYSLITIYIAYQLTWPNAHVHCTQNKHTTAPLAQEGHHTTQMPQQGCHPPTTDTVSLNESHRECLATDETFYCSTEFLQQVEHIETMAKERMKQKRAMNFTPPSFSLGISPEKEQGASHSEDIRPTALKFSFSPKGTGTASIAGVYYQRTHQAPGLDDRLAKSLESPRKMHNIDKAKAAPENAKGGHGKTKPSMQNDGVENQASKKGEGTSIKAAAKENSERDTFSMSITIPERPQRS